MSERASYYTRVDQVTIDRLKELKRVLRKSMSKIVTKLFADSEKAKRIYEVNGYKDKLPPVPKVVYPDAIIIMEGGKEVERPFPEELKKYYKRLSPYSKKQELRLWLDKDVPGRIKEVGDAFDVPAYEVLEKLVEVAYYELIVKGDMK